jgi:hypothetical protein
VSEAANPVTQCHIPEEPNPHVINNTSTFKSSKQLYALQHFIIQFHEYFQTLSEFIDYFTPLHLSMQYAFWHLWAAVGTATSKHGLSQ